MGVAKDLFVRYREIIMYLIVGGATTVINWGSYYLFTDFLSFELNIANITSWIISVTFAFFTNKLYVFQSKHLDMKTMTKEFSAFVGSRIFTGIIAWILFPILLYLGIDRFIIETPGMLAKIITSVVEIVLNWVLSKYFVFRKKPEQTE
ncbi:MAG: GtrA family protein [Candidatus Methanomethylophilaceae archaeon]|nr:GtrA family protein [Candidatus Methanomethylophilaceae archaeon]MBQ7979414.1 GtrA family protein [Candidatus Methanomethylophilaceae archaeon]MBQ9689523.1 GtrA family protein [Candidatus Methanomethylophilaceae archaeon]